jgi:hypothetical protein
MSDIQQEIESYIRNEMSSDERRDFETKIEADPELRKEVEEAIIIANGIRYAARNDLRQMAQNASNEFHGKQETRKLPGLLVIFGVVVILAGLAWLGYFYFEHSLNTEPTNTTEEKVNSGMASEGTSTEADNLGISNQSPLTSKNVTLLNFEGKETGESILVNIYRDEALGSTHYILEEDFLNFYLSATNEFSPELITNYDTIYIKSLTKPIPLIRDGMLHVLESQ